jgi:hypothetical protein
MDRGESPAGSIYVPPLNFCYLKHLYVIPAAPLTNIAKLSDTNATPTVVLSCFLTNNPL